MVALVRAVAALVAAGLGRYAVIGGVAVAVRLGAPGVDPALEFTVLAYVCDLGGEQRSKFPPLA